MSCGLFAGKYECEPPPLLTNEKQPSRPERLHYKFLTVPSIADLDLRRKGRTAPMYGQSCANLPESCQEYYHYQETSSRTKDCFWVSAWYYNNTSTFSALQCHNKTKYNEISVIELLKMTKHLVLFQVVRCTFIGGLRKILIKFDAIHCDFPKGYWYAIKELYFVRGMD